MSNVKTLLFRNGWKRVGKMKVKIYKSNVINGKFKWEILGKVRYNNNLDHWRLFFKDSDGRGLTRLKDGRFVLIYYDEWGHGPNNEKRWAEIISESRACNEILESEKYILLNKYFPNRFRELKAQGIIKGNIYTILLKKASEPIMIILAYFCIIIAMGLIGWILVEGTDFIRNLFKQFF